MILLSLQFTPSWINTLPEAVTMSWSSLNSPTWRLLQALGQGIGVVDGSGSGEVESGQGWGGVVGWGLGVVGSHLDPGSPWADATKISKANECPNILSNYSIIGVTLNTKLDTLWLSQVGGPMEGLTKKYDTSPESWVPGAKPGVGFMLIASVLCLPSQFENCTFCRAEYSEILPVYAIWQKIGMSCKLSGKTKFSMASC